MTRLRSGSVDDWPHLFQSHTVQVVYEVVLKYPHLPIGRGDFEPIVYCTLFFSDKKSTDGDVKMARSSNQAGYCF